MQNLIKQQPIYTNQKFRTMFGKTKAAAEEFKAKYKAANPRSIALCAMPPTQIMLKMGLSNTLEYQWQSAWVNAMEKYVKPAPFYKKALYNVARVVWGIAWDPQGKRHNEANKYYQFDTDLKWKTYDEYKQYDLIRRSETQFNLSREDRAKFIQLCDRACSDFKGSFVIKEWLENFFDVPKL